MPAMVDTEDDIERLKLRIMEAASKRTSVTRPPRRRIPAASGSSIELDLPELKFTPDFHPAPDHHYHVNDLLQFHDREFVRNAYRAILKREPDQAGLQDFLEKLRSGEINKIDVLAQLRGSREGKQNDVVIEGLTVPATIRSLGRLPLVGYLLQLLIAFFRLPKSIADRRQFESHSLQQDERIAQHINRLSGVTRELATQVDLWPQRLADQRLELLDLLEQQRTLHQQMLLSHEQTLLSHQRMIQQQMIQQFTEVTNNQKDLGERLDADLAAQLDQISSQSKAIEQVNNLLSEMRVNLSLQHAQTASLMSALKDPAQKPDAEALLGVDKEWQHRHDALYALLEDRFRGDRSELKEKFKVYLPYLEDAGITSEVLDLGSGRGEWLELLRDKGIQAKGVDSNRVMSDRCAEAQLDVLCVDVMSYLRTLPDSSVSAVTSFHLIEHLEFDELITLVDQIMRILKPEGILIFETPNPENVLVGSCNFHLDPSHRRPVPSEMMSFVLEARGFAEVEIINLHPLASQRIDGDTELTHRFNDVFYGPMDYGIIARRNPSRM
jgi:O-antigen chain-terminating methyltransferase